MFDFRGEQDVTQLRDRADWFRGLLAGFQVCSAQALGPARSKFLQRDDTSVGLSSQCFGGVVMQFERVARASRP